MSEAWKSRLLAAAIVALPVHAAAQLTVTDPAPGQAVSYRNSQIQWLPMPGVTDYHLQVDDDPAFRSPEIDVIVQQPSYVLFGEDRLRLNGQLSWAQYVRVNGLRWSVPTFTPSYVTRAFWPEVAIGGDGKVFYGYLGGELGEAFAAVRTSDDFSSARQLVVPTSNGNPDGLALGVDPAGVAHMYWTDQIFGTPALPLYANSIDWTPRVIGDQVFGAFDAGSSMVIAGSNVDIFDEGFSTAHWFSSTDGGQTFTQTEVPESDGTISVYATADAPTGVLLVEERGPSGSKQVVLQRSATGWQPEIAGSGRWPSAAAGADGVVHVLSRSDATAEVSYSNSARGFARWTPVPVGRVIGQQLLPIVVDDARQRIYVAAPSATTTLLCASDDMGDSWSCRRVGGREPRHPDLKLDSTGVLHVAWAEARGGGYATSLGSFQAVNVSPRALLSEGVPWPNTIIIPAAVADSDGDDMDGSVAVGTNELRRVRLFRNDHLPLLGDEIVFNGTALFAMNRSLLFRALGGDWVSVLPLDDMAFPHRVDVQTLEGRAIDLFTIRGWDGLSVVIDRWEFTAHVREAFEEGRLPLSIDISSAPTGPLTMRVAVHDGASRRVFDAPFFRAEGRDHLALADFRPGAEAFMSLLDEMPADSFRAPVFRSVLGSEMNGVVFAIERALIAADAETRAALLDAAGSRLQTRVLGRINGCRTAGKPDEDDWVVSCVDQRRLAVAAGQVLHAIAALR